MTTNLNSLGSKTLIGILGVKPKLRHQSPANLLVHLWVWTNASGMLTGVVRVFSSAFSCFALITLFIGPKPSELYGKFTWKIEKFSQTSKKELKSDIFEVGCYKWYAAADIPDLLCLCVVYSLDSLVVILVLYKLVHLLPCFVLEDPDSKSLYDVSEKGIPLRYILIYPQGCDVCNHLSLFLCVANHDKLYPGMISYSSLFYLINNVSPPLFVTETGTGWGHFAQFTIAVVNNDPKKSKYSDTLHRFWKKEHDWGWKKFMELSKLQDGFLVGDKLEIRAQVQVVREKVNRPFRCLDRQYRRELVRVYLTNVEQICRLFVEDRRGKLWKLMEDKLRWSSLSAFWRRIDLNSRWRMSREKMDVILRVIVKHFFVENEVTSTLVMDSLFSGMKVLESQSGSKKGRATSLDSLETAFPIVQIEDDMFVLADDVLALLARAVLEPLPPKEEKGPQNRTKDGCSGEDFSKDSIERDERRLTILGWRTLEIFVLAHIFSKKIEVAYQEAVALKRQEELIREEEANQAENELKAKRQAAKKEKRSKKKLDLFSILKRTQIQVGSVLDFLVGLEMNLAMLGAGQLFKANLDCLGNGTHKKGFLFMYPMLVNSMQNKQRRNNHKGKDKGKCGKCEVVVEKKCQGSPSDEKREEELTENRAHSVPIVIEALIGVSDESDTGDDPGERFQLDLEDRDASPVSWDTDTSEVHPSAETCSSGMSSMEQNGQTDKNPLINDDSSSTCSTDSTPSVVTNGPYRRGLLLTSKSQMSPSR
ncbi:MATH/TRAF domain [Dillenia turbinata]|uniref:MATH/TRAF domain n=1 Tax=Dillenia turbinata TaxID=194707 RepID=A0AAN8YW92_9MAGN